MTIEVHVSDVRTFKQCKRKWLGSSLLGLGLEPKKPFLPFFTGKGIHHAWQHHYDYGTPLEAAFNTWCETEIGRILNTLPQEQRVAEQTRLLDQVDLGVQMMRHATLWLQRLEETQDPLRDSAYRFIATETGEPLPFGRHSYDELGELSETEFYYSFRLDGVLQKIEDGSYWILEHKTARSIDELINSLVLDQQSSMYMWAAQRLLRLPISGVLYNVMRKKAPESSRLLNNGRLSTNKAQDTSFEWFKHDVLRHNQDPKDYSDFLQTLWLESKDSFFKRVEIRKSQAQLAKTAKDILATARDMARYVDMAFEDMPISPALPGAMNYCSNCIFKNPCVAAETGGDPQFLFEAQYVKRKGWNEDETLVVNNA